MPEQQETTRLYLVSSLLIDITSRVLSKTLNVVCSRLNTAFEPLLNLNRHNFFHLWKTEPCCQCSETPEVNSVVHFRESDWARLYQRHQRQCRAGTCSCCYRALPGIQPNSIDFSLSTKVLVNLKALYHKEYEYVREIRKYEPELKQAQEDRLVPYRKSSKLPKHWREALATVEKLAKESGDGYWENLKEVKKLKQILSEVNEDDGFQIRFKEDECGEPIVQNQEDVALTELLTPKDNTPLTDSAYFEQIEENEDKQEQGYDKSTLHADDADSGYPDNLSFKSPRDPLDDDIHGRTGYIDDTITEESYTAGSEFSQKDPLFWEKQHGLFLQRLEGECQKLSRRCSNLVQDTKGLRKRDDLPSPDYQTTPVIPSFGRQTGHHSQSVDSSYPGHHKAPLTNEEFSKLMEASYDCLVNSRAVLQNSSPLDADRDFIYSSSAREYVRWLDARNADDTDDDLAVDVKYENDEADNSAPHHDKYESFGFHGNTKAEGLWTKLEERDEPNVAQRTPDFVEEHFSLDEADGKSGEIFMKWVEDTTRFSQRPRQHQIERDEYWTPMRNYTHVDDFVSSKSNSFDGSDFYKRSMEKCEKIKQRSDTIRFEVQRSQNRLRAMNKRDGSLVQDLESVSSIDEEMFYTAREYPSVAPRECYEYESETRLSPKYNRFVASPAVSPRRSDHYKRHSTPIHMAHGTSYLDKYATWLSDSVKKVEKDPKYGNQRARKWERESEVVAMSSPVYEDMPDGISDDEEDCRLLPRLSSSPRSVVCFRLSNSCPQLPQTDLGRCAERTRTVDRNDRFSGKSVQEFNDCELAELTEEKKYGNFLSRSKESLSAMRERSLQTRMEIERVRSQFLTGTV